MSGKSKYIDLHHVWLKILPMTPRTVCFFSVMSNGTVTIFGTNVVPSDILHAVEQIVYRVNYNRQTELLHDD